MTRNRQGLFGFIRPLARVGLVTFLGAALLFGGGATAAPSYCDDEAFPSDVGNDFGPGVFFVGADISPSTTGSQPHGQGVWICAVDTGGNVFGNGGYGHGVGVAILPSSDQVALLPGFCTWYENGDIICIGVGIAVRTNPTDGTDQRPVVGKASCSFGRNGGFPFSSCSNAGPGASVGADRAFATTTNCGSADHGATWTCTQANKTGVDTVTTNTSTVTLNSACLWAGGANPLCADETGTPRVTMGPPIQVCVVDHCENLPSVGLTVSVNGQKVCVFKIGEAVCPAP